MLFADYLIYSILCLSIIYIYVILKKTSDLPPGPWNLPIVGYLPWLDPRAPHLSLSKLSKKFGSIYGLYMGTIYTVVVSDVKMIKKIQWKDKATGRPSLFLNKIATFEKGIVNAQGNLWKNQRKFVMNYFKDVGVSKLSHNRKKMEAQINDQVRDFMENIQSEGVTSVVNPAEVLVHNTGSIICKIMLGESYSRGDEAWVNVLHGIHNVSKIMGFSGPLNFLPFLRFLPTYNRKLQMVQHTVDAMINITTEFINKKGHSVSGNNLVEAFLTKQKSGEQPDIYTDHQLTCLMNDLLAAGLETSATSLSWYFLYLAVHQEVQQEVRREIEETLHRQDPKLDHLHNLHYLRASLAEVARIRTVLPLGFPHCASDDIYVAGVKIPKGAMIVSLLWEVHTDSAVWGDPEVFRPERFLDEEGKFFAPESFIPFHTGRRVCAGEELAKMVLFLFAANIVKNFFIEAQDAVDLEGISGITLQPKPHRLRFTKISMKS